MIQEASITGLLRTIFIIVGVIAVLRFIGRFLILKREQEKLKDLDRRQAAEKKAKEFAEKRRGKISIHSENTDLGDGNTVDIDFEETK